MTELLWQLFQFTDPSRCSGGVRPSQPSVGLLFSVGPLEVVRGTYFVEEFPPFSPSFIACLHQPNGGRGSFTGNVGQTFGILIRAGALQTVLLWQRDPSAAGRTTDWCVQCPGLAIKRAFLVPAGGTQHLWFPSHLGRIAVVQPGGYKYMDPHDQGYEQYSVFHFLQGFPQLLLFTDLMVLRSPKGPQNHSLTVWSRMLRETLSL